MNDVQSARTRVRTWDLPSISRLLYQLSYARTLFTIFIRFLNTRPTNFAPPITSGASYARVGLEYSKNSLFKQEKSEPPSSDYNFCKKGTSQRKSFCPIALAMIATTMRMNSMPTQPATVMSPSTCSWERP